MRKIPRVGKKMYEMYMCSTGEKNPFKEKSERENEKKLKILFPFF